MIRSRERGVAVAAFALGAVFIVVLVAPLVFLYGLSLWGDDGLSLAPYRDVLRSSRQWALLVRSVGLALSVALCATLLGASAGFALEKVSARWRTAFAFFLTLPLVIPQHIMAIAWVDVLGRSGYLSRFVQIAMPGSPPAPGPYNLAGALFILTMTTFPIPMLAAIAAARRFDVRYSEAAQLAGQSRRAFWDVKLPLLLPAILTGSFVVFAVSVSTFAVPSLLQVNTYPVEIHASSTSFEYGPAAAQSLPMVLICAMVYFAWSLYVRPRHAWLSGAARHANDERGERRRVLATTFVCAVAAVTLIVPLAALLVRSMPLRTYASVWSTAHDEICTGLFVAFASATCLALLALALFHFTRSVRVRTFVRYASLTAFVLPGPLLALGMIAEWNRPGPAGLVYDSVAILVLACVARFYAVGDAAFAAQYARMNPRLLEAASVSGVNARRQFFGIVLPLSLPFVLAVWVLAFIFALGEVDAAVLISPPGVSTFALRLFSLMHYGPDSFVAALSLITAVLSGVLAACGLAGYHVLSRRFDARA